MTFTVQRHCWTVRLWRPHERHMASPSAFSRRLCVAAVTMAFVIGIAVGILLPLYVPSSSSALALLPHSAPANQPLRGNASETNAIIANGPWEGMEGSDDVLRVSNNDPETAPRAGLTPHRALSKPPVDAPPSLFAKIPMDARIFSQKWRAGSDDASRNRIQDGNKTPGDRDVAKDLPVFSKKHAEWLRRTSARKSTDPPTNATTVNGRSDAGQGLRTPGPATTNQPEETRREARPLQNSVQPGKDLPETQAPPAVDATPEALVDGVYWNDRVERSLPEGFSEQETAEWTSFAGSAPVVRVAEGCGRMQNRLLMFENGSRSCCRYRQNNDQIQGEIFSYYLARLLGLRSLPPATLGLPHGHEVQWGAVRGQLTLAQWNEQKPVVMTKFVDDLVPAHIPRHFRGDGPRELRRLHPLPEDLAGLRPEEIREVAQWSDLVIFDYLTANLDRVVNNMYNKQWNPDMMAAPAHNLAKVAKTGLLVFLDNESGLLHGYRLLDKYESYHKAMLEGLCIFRRSTARAVLKLHYAGDVGQKLKMGLMESQPQMAEWLPLLPDKSVKILRERLARVAQQILQCENMYMNTSSTTDSNLIGSQDDLNDSLTRPSVDSS